MSQPEDMPRDTVRQGAAEQEAAVHAPPLSAGDQAEFLARISHEIRTPLNAIMGYAEMLGKTALDSRQEYFTGNIVKSALNLVELLDTWLLRIKAPERDAHPVAADPAQHRGGWNDAAFKLLVVEDSSMIRDLFLDIFNDDAATVFTTGSGARALELAQGEELQLIFIDLHLPDTDGWQLAQTLRGNPRTAAIPLVAMTGQLLQPEEYDPYFNGYLQKPFQLKQLRSLVDTWKNTLAQAREEGAAAAPHTGPAPAPAAAPPEPQQEDWAERLRPFWSTELAALLERVGATGSLQATAELGRCMRQRGEERHCPLLQEAGERLLHHATGPDIAAVEALLAQLAPLAGHKET